MPEKIFVPEHEFIWVLTDAHGNPIGMVGKPGRNSMSMFFVSEPAFELWMVEIKKANLWDVFFGALVAPPIATKMTSNQANEAMRIMHEMGFNPMMVHVVEGVARISALQATKMLRA